MQGRTLRGHHVLCVHGFRGMGYSPDFVKKMHEIVDEIRNDSLDFPIQVVEGLDDACGACPNRGEALCSASPGSEPRVRQMDRRVMEHIGITDGETIGKRELVERTARRVRPEDLDVLCRGCSWLSYGVCKTGIRRLNAKYEW